MNNDLTCSCSCTPDSTPTDTSPDFLYAHQSPYPPVCIKEQNPLYGRMMLDNMGGQESEMSTIGLYIYNSIFLTSDTARIAEIFKNISIRSQKNPVVNIRSEEHPSELQSRRKK